MTNELIDAILQITNANAVGSLPRDDMEVTFVRDILIKAGCIRLSSPNSYIRCEDWHLCPDCTS